MIRAMNSSARTAPERKALRRRVEQMYDWLNQERWEKCYSLIDPQLREPGKVEAPVYAERLQAFKKAYGGITPWFIRISLHCDASSNKNDARPFAYVYVIWQDERHAFHMFRERWVKNGDRWYTRVVGLVPNQQATT
jgi:hypothetical protein